MMSFNKETSRDNSPDKHLNRVATKVSYFAPLFWYVERRRLSSRGRRGVNWKILSVLTYQRMGMSWTDRGMTCLDRTMPTSSCESRQRDDINRGRVPPPHTHTYTHPWSISIPSCPSNQRRCHQQRGEGCFCVISWKCPQWAREAVRKQSRYAIMGGGCTRTRRDLKSLFCLFFSIGMTCW